MNLEKIGTKFSAGKVRYDLIPILPLEQVAWVCTHGAEIHGVNNWRSLPVTEWIPALQRHLAQVLKGDVLDADSGMPHLAHMAVNCLFLLEHFCAKGYIPPDYDLSGLKEKYTQAKIKDAERRASS